MKVFREKSILDKIDEEINKKGLPNVVRIDLDEGEFEDFIRELSSGMLGTTFDSILTGLKTNYIDKVGRSKVRVRNGNWLGSYVVYRDTCVQCCYEEE